MTDERRSWRQWRESARLLRKLARETGDPTYASAARHARTRMIYAFLHLEYHRR